MRQLELHQSPLNVSFRPYVSNLSYISTVGWRGFTIKTREHTNISLLSTFSFKTSLLKATEVRMRTQRHQQATYASMQFFLVSFSEKRTSFLETRRETKTGGGSIYTSQISLLIYPSLFARGGKRSAIIVVVMMMNIRNVIIPVASLL